MSSRMMMLAPKRKKQSMTQMKARPAAHYIPKRARSFTQVQNIKNGALNRFKLLAGSPSMSRTGRTNAYDETRALILGILEQLIRDTKAVVDCGGKKMLTLAALRHALRNRGRDVYF